MDPLDLTALSPNQIGDALGANQQAALDLARKLENEAEKLVSFSPARMALEGAARRLREYIAVTL